jgi:hypothetical protein
MIVDFGSLWDSRQKKEIHKSSFPRLYRYRYDLEFYDKGRKRRFEMTTNLMCYTIEQGREMIYRSVQPDDEVRIISEQCVCDRIDGMDEEIISMIMNVNKKQLNLEPITNQTFQKLGKVESIPNSIQVRSVKTNTQRIRTDIPKDKGEHFE